MTLRKLVETGIFSKKTKVTVLIMEISSTVRYNTLEKEENITSERIMRYYDRKIEYFTWADYDVMEVHIR